MQSWIKSYLTKLSPSDRERYEYLKQLREISTHDSTVRPDGGAISVEVFDTRMGMEVGAPWGNVVYQPAFGWTGAENFTNRVGVKYFFADRPDEDIVSFCKGVVRILESLVTQAYALYP